MGPEELPSNGERDVPAAEPAPEHSVPAPGPKRVDVTQWVIGLVVALVLAFPLLHRLIHRGDDAAAPAAANLSASDQTMLNQSFALYQAGKYDEAIAVGQALVKANPNVASGWNNLSASYAKLGRWDDAIRCAQQALRIEPGHELAKGNLAYAQSAKTGAPGTLQYFLNLSAEEYRAGKFPECIADAAKAIDLDPQNAAGYNNKGACYGSLGMFAEEIQAEQEAIRLNPANQLAKNNLNWALERKKVRDSVREKK
jgi:tetratricopeptide (TPR) repeat protein